jgi:nitroreductase
LAEVGDTTKLKLLRRKLSIWELKECMDVLEAIKGRRSVRAFKSEKNISEETVEKIIEAARWAPSAGNIQPWEFIIVRRPEIRKRLAAAAFNQSFIEQAPVVIVVCADENRSSEGYGQRGKTLYCIQDTAAAIQNIHLAAYSNGLSTCWIGAFEEEEASEILQIPQGIRPVAMIPLGYAAKFPSPRRKRDIHEIIHYEAFQAK